MPGRLRQELKLLATWHRPSGRPNVFLHSLPRSGSTWLMELVQTQPGFRAVNEPLNLRVEAVRDHLGIQDWAAIHQAEAKTALARYFDAWSSGRLHDARFDHPMPFTDFYRPLTHRTVFKIINAAEEHINWLADTFNGRVLFLLRHPIPVSRSRKYFPKLDTILGTDFRRFFTDGQISVAERIIVEGDTFARGVLDWCLRNSVMLRSRTPAWTVVTYEQLVLDAEPVVRLMAERLELPRPDLALKRLAVPSQSAQLSQARTREVLVEKRDEGKQRWLVEKWRKEIDEDSLAAAESIVRTFELDEVYDVRDTLAKSAYWID